MQKVEIIFNLNQRRIRMVGGRWFFSRRQFSIKSIDLEKEILKQQHYKEDFLLWLKTDAGKRFLDNISERDLQWMKDNYTEEELVGCFGIGFLERKCGEYGLCH